MHSQRFDDFVKTLRTRRSLLGGVAGVLVILGVDHEAAAKCKKKCGPCKRCKKGKCKPKPNNTPCGPCSRCELGACRALCPIENCVSDDGEVITCESP